MKLDEIAKGLKLKISGGKRVSRFYEAETDVLEIYFGNLQISETLIEDITDKYSLQFVQDKPQVFSEDSLNNLQDRGNFSVDNTEASAENRYLSFYQSKPQTNEITGITIRNFNKLLNWYFE